MKIRYGIICERKKRCKLLSERKARRNLTGDIELLGHFSFQFHFMFSSV